MGNCDTWMEVDFGEGPVRIRCTQTGNHAQCRTEVFFRNDSIEHRNVFETRETD